LAFAVLGVLFALVPFLDKGASRGRPSPALTAAGVLVFAYFLVLTCYVWLH
jgi:hypothetical protein